MAKDIKTYYEQSYIDNTLRLREVLRELPSFVRDYFRAIEPSTSAKTRISYAYDLRVFFNFLIENNPIFRDYTTAQFKVSDLEQIEAIDIEDAPFSYEETDILIKSDSVEEELSLEEQNAQIQ